jgi:hypothetical protein
MGTQDKLDRFLQKRWPTSFLQAFGYKRAEDDKMKNSDRDHMPDLRINYDITQHKHDQRNEPGPPEYPGKVLRSG